MDISLEMGPGPGIWVKCAECWVRPSADFQDLRWLTLFTLCRRWRGVQGFIIIKLMGDSIIALSPIRSYLSDAQLTSPQSDLAAESTQIMRKWRKLIRSQSKRFFAGLITDHGPCPNVQLKKSPWLDCDCYYHLKC